MRIGFVGLGLMGTPMVRRLLGAGHAVTGGNRSPAKAQALHEVGARVVVALEDLPAEFREVLVLREFEELSYREIASVTGLPTGTVMSRLARARMKLAERRSVRAKGETP